VLAGITKLVGTTVNEYISLYNKSYEIFEITKVDSLLSAITREVDEHRLLILPRIQKFGKITLADGSLNPVSLRSDNLKPSIHSDAITSVKISALNTLWIVDRDLSTNPLLYYVCPSFPAAFSKDIAIEADEFIGIGTDSFVELQGSALEWPEKKDKDCLILSLSAVTGMISNLPDPDELPFIASIIPTQKIYTLYVDSKRRLRYLGHQGNRNIENQPLLDGPLELSLRFSNWPATNFRMIKRSLKISHKLSPTRIFPQRFARISNSNFLFNAALNYEP